MRVAWRTRQWHPALIRSGARLALTPPARLSWSELPGHLIMTVRSLACFDFTHAYIIFIGACLRNRRMHSLLSQICAGQVLARGLFLAIYTLKYSIKSFTT